MSPSGVKQGDDGPIPEPFPQWAMDFVGNIASGAGGPEMVDCLATMTERASAAHTAAIYVRVAGQSSTASSSDLAREWLARLVELEDRLSDDRIAEIPIWDWVPYSDGVSEQHLRHNREALLEAIGRAAVLSATAPRGRLTVALLSNLALFFVFYLPLSYLIGLPDSNEARCAASPR